MPAEKARPALAKNIISLGLCFGLAWLGSSIFIQIRLLRFLISLPAASFFLLAALRRQKGRLILLSREQFKWFLELLLSHLASGETLEHAISSTLPGMQQMLGSKQPLIRALKALDQQLEARRPLADLLPYLASQISCPEADYFFRLLPELQSSGSQIAPFVRQHLHMVAEQMILQQEIKAESTQRRTEAGLLAVMPFLVALLLRPGLADDSASVMAGPAGVIGSSLACIIALTAAGLTFSLMAGQPTNSRKSLALPSAQARPSPWLLKLSRPLYQLYRDILPPAYGARLIQALADLAGDQAGLGKNLLDAYFLRKTQFILLALPPGFILLFLSPTYLYLPFCLALLLVILQDRQVFGLRRQVLDDYRLSYPVFLNLLAALLQAGLSVHRSLAISSSCLYQNSRKIITAWPSLDRDLALVQRQLQTGQPVGQVLEMLIAACPLPEAQAALLLLLRYEQAGGADTIQLLTLQANACWSLYRSSSRKQLEQQSLALLLPMALDLVAVMITALLPALLSLNIL